MELNFEDIVSGKEPKHVNEEKQAQETKLKQTETRARQQSCMISEVDKDLVQISLIKASSEHED
jgi:formiminotetrahydrofolate cyclodeaminase